MKSKSAIGLFLLLVSCAFLFNSCNNKDKPASDNEIKVTGAQTYSDSATSSVKVFDQNGRVCIQQTNTFYELVDVYEGTAKIPLLLKIKKTELCFADSVNKHKVYEVEAHSVMDTKSVQWSNQFVATEIIFKDNTLLATHEGTEVEEDFLTRFSLLDGKEVFSCSYGELKAVVPNVRNKRFIGYTSQKAASQPLQSIKEENLLGIVRYASGLQAINGAKIILKRSAVAANIPVYTPDMVLVATAEGTTVIEEGKSIIMMKADEHYTSKDLTGFSVQLTFYYGDDNESTNILIPVTEDKLDITKATFDKDIFEIVAM